MVILPVHLGVVQIKEQLDGHQVTPQVTPEATPEVGRIQVVVKETKSCQEIQKKLDLKDEKHFRETYQQPAVGNIVLQ